MGCRVYGLGSPLCGIAQVYMSCASGLKALFTPPSHIRMVIDVPCGTPDQGPAGL